METVKIPNFEDPEGYKGKVIVEDLHTFKISTSVDASYTSFTVSPVLFDSVGSHTLTISLNDDNLSESQSMTVNVLNDAPVFTDPALQNYKMQINKTLEVSISNFSDYESHEIFMSFYHQIGG